MAELRQRGGKALLRQVHTLATVYHWSEQAILSLPLERRLGYLLLIEAERDAALIAGGGIGSVLHGE